MAVRFSTRAVAGPAHISADPTKALPPGQFLEPGIEQRPFSDAEIKQAFDAFDLDNNKFLGVAEVRHILDVMGEAATDEEIDEMIRMCDGDGDGQVSFDEFYRMLTESEPVRPPEPPEHIRTRKLRTKAEMSRTYRKVATQALPDLDESDAARKSSKKQAAKEDSERKEQAQKIRAVSVETLVQKLSGGMGKIKPSQVKRVYKRFQDIDVDKSGAIEYHEFLQALEMEDNVISKQMFRVFDMDDSGSIELKEFIVVLSRYTTAARAEKLKFAFMMFDEDSSGYIERDELLRMMQASFVVEGYSQAELEDKADQVFEFLNLPRDGVVSYDDFLQLAKAQTGMIYPIEEQRYTLGNDFSIDKMLQEVL